MAQNSHALEVLGKRIGNDTVNLALLEQQHIDDTAMIEQLRTQIRELQQQLEQSRQQASTPSTEPTE